MGNQGMARAYAPKLDRRMRATLFVVGVVVATGLGAAAWMLLSPAPPDGAQTAAPLAQPTTGSGPVVGATPVPGSEVQDPDPSRAPIDRIPARTAATPRVSAPLPETASATGGLVAGLPVDLAAPLDGSDVLDSSVASEGTTVQFSLRARTDTDADTVRESYAALWAGLGLAADDTASADGTSFEDAYTSVSVTADATTGTGTVYTVYGVLRAA